MESKFGGDRQTSTCKILKILGSESNVHGISKIAKAHSTPRRIFWIVLILLASSLTTFQIVSIINKYLTYPIAETIHKSQKTHITFPSVTLCNTNPISSTQLNQMIQNSSDVLAWFEFLRKANLGEKQTKLESNQAFYENLPEIAKDIGNSFDELVLHCRFNNEECGVQNFSSHFDGKTYYNCFTFKVSTNEMQVGIDHGLSLILSTGNRFSPPGSYGIYDFNNPKSSGLGARVQIHAPDTTPSPLYDGFDVPPGYSMNIGLKASLHTSLPLPYGECVINEKRTDKNTLFTCFEQCKQDIIIKKCGCKTSALPDTHNSKVPFCLQIKNWRSKLELYNNENVVALEMVDCVRQVLEEIRNDRSFEDHCECYQPCKETSYHHSTSMLYWPEEFYQFSFLTTLNKTSKQTSELVSDALDTLNKHLEKYKNGMKVTYDTDDEMELAKVSNIIHKNFMRLNVYFQDIRVTEYTQIPTYNLASLLSDIGGVLILWLGFSVLSFMELFEFIMVLIMHVCKSHLYIFGNKSG